MLELRHLVIIQMDEAMSTFYQRWLDIDIKQEFFKYLTIRLIGNQTITWDMDLAKLFHLTDPECNHCNQGGTQSHDPNLRSLDVSSHNEHMINLQWFLMIERFASPLKKSCMVVPI